ncbi:hypothetical protein M9H77_34182 [Catharanthus roseus]|uniref:Uncharacterized protein n=1 Tax=Catharanthus roseus TaxID=4058 RepID=A0ACB9ZML2_CATRO|nr:hypothetical protein M9H77_34182 [Catharanthus roseus]
MSELVSDDLVMGSGLCPWSPTIAIHVLLNSVLTIRFYFVRTRWHTTLVDGYTRRARSWLGPTRLHHHRLAQGIGLGSSIEEDPSKPESDSKIVPSQREWHQLTLIAVGTFLTNGSPIVALPTLVLPVESISSFPALSSLLLWDGVRKHDICDYCLWREQRIEAAGQQIIELRDEVSRIDGLFYTAP